MRAAVTLLAGLVAACAAQPTPGVTLREVQIPVSLPCPAVVTARPDFVDDEVALGLAEGRTRYEMLYNRVRLLLAGRLQRTARIDEVETALRVCGVAIPGDAP